MKLSLHKRKFLRTFIFAALVFGVGFALFHFALSPWISRAADQRDMTLSVRVLPPTANGHILLDLVFVNGASHYVAIDRGVGFGEFGIQVRDCVTGVSAPLTAEGKLRLYSRSNPQSLTSVPPGGACIWRNDLNEMFIFQPGMMYTVRGKIHVERIDSGCFTLLDLKSNVDWFQDPSTSNK